MSIINKYLKSIIAMSMALVMVISCTDSLDVTPPDEDVVTSAQVFENVDDFRRVLAKLYGGFSLTGQTGPAGNPDIQGIDEGFSNYIRQLWVHQELPTDEAVVAWTDPGLPEFNFQTWGANNDFVDGMYSRVFFQITLTNEFIRNAQGRDESEIQLFNAEARFLRALSYWHALDLFGGNVPFVTEEDEIGAFLPEQTNAQDLFAFIESELLAIEDQLPAPGENEFGRADRGALWTLLTKLYLNAEVYIGQDRSADAVEFAERVINSGYQLEDEYANLFLADNDQADGIIFTIPFDGVNTRTFGGTTFIIHAAIGEDMSPSDFGVDVGWAGHRVTPEFVNNFIDISQAKQRTETSANNSFATIQMDDVPKVFVPGGYQEAAGYGNNWTPADAPALADLNEDNIFVGYVYFDTDGAEFKITPERNFDNDFGDNEGDGTLEPMGANLTVDQAGYHRLEVNLNDSTYTATRTEWGIIGTSLPQGFDADEDMTYEVENMVWTITTPLSEGEIKFRANDDWDINFGVANAGDSVLVRDGNNIQINEAGNYKVIMKLGEPPFTFRLQETDTREMFFTEGQQLEIPDVRQFANGFAITKWSNLTSEGTPGKDPTFPDTDFPMFRLADVLLMHAEALIRSGGDRTAALESVNMVRERAGAEQISMNELTLDFLLTERARELYWEAHRRTDLRRFGVFTSGEFIWAWKGGVEEGTGTQDFLNIYPIPASEINANPNLTQNPGY